MNYVIPRFVLDHLPIGLAGLFIAAVIAAAMSAISGELNSLSTTTVIDFYRRWIRREATDAHFLMVSRAATGFWGLFACIIATYAVEPRLAHRGREPVRLVLLWIHPRRVPAGDGAARARRRGAFIGLLAGMSAV